MAKRPLSRTHGLCRIGYQLSAASKPKHYLSVDYSSLCKATVPFCESMWPDALKRSDIDRTKRSRPLTLVARSESGMPLKLFNY